MRSLVTALVLSAVVVVGCDTSDPFDTMPGGHLPHAEQVEIEHATCAQLRPLYARYQGNADSTQPAQEGIDLVVRRIKVLRCGLPR
jgi:hypothetical protein